MVNMCIDRSTHPNLYRLVIVLIAEEIVTAPTSLMLLPWRLHMSVCIMVDTTLILSWSTYYNLLSFDSAFISEEITATPRSLMLLAVRLLM